MSQIEFRKINYRNGMYQGQVNESLNPHGEGILLDDQLRFILTLWNNGNIDGKTLIFQSHSKYMYGNWEDGLPEGINVYREGSNVLVSNYVNGLISDKLLVVLEDQRLMLEFSNQNGYLTLQKQYQNVNERMIVDGLRYVGLSETSNLQNILSLTKYIKQHYTNTTLHLQISHPNDFNFIGISDGLGILFNDDNFISRIGLLDSHKQNCGLGGFYSYNICKEGDFQRDDLIEYEGHRPQEQFKEVIKNCLLRSLNFKNEYLLTTVDKVMQYNQTIFKKDIFPQLARSSLKKYSLQDLNQSLDYPQDQNKNQRLKKMRAELYLSIGRPGSEIRPLKSQVIKKFIQTQNNQNKFKNEKHHEVQRDKQNSHYREKSFQRTRKPSGYNLVSDKDSYHTPSHQIFNKYQLDVYRKSKSPIRKTTEITPAEPPLKSKSILSKYDKSSLIPPQQQCDWIKEARRNITQVRLSRSPLKNRTQILANPNLYHAPSLEKKSLHSNKNTITFGTSSKKQISIQESKNIHSSNNPLTSIKQSHNKSKYNIQEVNNQIDLFHQSSPARIVSEESKGYVSPYKNIKEPQENPHLKSTEIKTISRRVDKPEVLPRTSSKYNYIGSLELL